MKGFFLSFLMLVMLTPSLACAMPCADSRQAVQATPCADHAAAPETKKTSDTVKLVIDCMGVDMQAAADHHAALIKPDTGADIIVYALADQILLPRPGDAEPKILGPPPDSPASSETHPSILLTTKRFRL